MSSADVASPIDLRDPTDAREWERTAQSRPGRIDMFNSFASELHDVDREEPHVLELGSGPGFLALHLLDALPQLHLTMLDFSEAMHELARARLTNHLNRVRFINRSFKAPGWSEDLGKFDAVITHQAVHELRHKRHAEGLHVEVAEILEIGAPYLVCDHFYGDGGLKNDQLYMTIDEHRNALLSAGFGEVRRLAVSGSLVMHRAGIQRRQ